MFRNKKLLLGIISLVLVTAVISFAAGAAVLYGWYNLYPRYEISFDPRNVSVDNIKKFNQVRSILKDRFYENVDENALIEGSISGMADALKDPYTVYFNKEQMKAFSEKSGGSYVGIGVTITMDNNGLLTIIEPFADSPALKAGIRKDDKIVKVDDQDVTAIRDENMIISMIKGPENSKVKVTVYRPADGKYIDCEMLRKKIKVTNISSEMLANNIGYIKLTMFDNEIAADFEKHLKGLMAKNMKALVIDVRDNPGGAYDQVVAICDRLLPKGLIVYTEDRNKVRSEQNSDSNELNLPIAVLTNGNSASASEILAGALKDHNKGILVGTKTFGKGLVQEVRTLGDGAGLKITIARYFTPSGVCIQGVGIQPTVVVELPEKYKSVPVSQVPKEEDTQLKKAIELISKPQK